MATDKPAPDQERTDGGPPGVELLRIRLADGTAYVWLPSPDGMGSAEMWGYLLCDAMLHIANAYQVTGRHDFRRTVHGIHDALKERLRSSVAPFGTPAVN